MEIERFMDSNINNFLIIGNGFDLYHNLKTKYYNFVQYARELSEGTNSDSSEDIQIAKTNFFLKYFYKVCEVNDNWIDCEREIENVILTLQKLLNIQRNAGKTKFKSNELGLTSAQKLVVDSGCLDRFFRKEPQYVGIKVEFISDNVFKEDYFFEIIKNELENLILLLSHYLANEELNLDVTKQYNQIKLINPNCIINFNYTNIYEKIYGKTDDIIYVHGSLEKQNSMVLGVPDNDKISLDFIYFKKYFQRIQKRCRRLKTLKFIKQMGIDSVLPTTYFLGLSMGRTDEDLIKFIIEKSSKVIIFYYDQIDYEKKIINLIDIYGREIIEENIDKGDFKFVQLDKTI